MGVKFFLLILILLGLSMRGKSLEKIFSVIQFGARSDSIFDNREPFQNAWKAACGSILKSTMVIPQGRFLLSTAYFQSPCKKPIHVEIHGIVLATAALSNSPYWMMFTDLKNFSVTGTNMSLLDGQGISLKLESVVDGVIRNLKIKDSKGYHMSIHRSESIRMESMEIKAPWNIPNTDGIHISKSSYVNITSSVIGVGDDCVSIRPGARHITVSGVFCGPGHGISVGSLGKYAQEEDVVDILVRNCTLSHTTNGVRIKTWRGSFASRAYRFRFEDIHMDRSSNPIIIDQDYCPGHQCPTTPPSHVQVSDITFKGVRGISQSKLAVTLRCKSAIPCSNITLVDINLSYMNGYTTSFCSYAHGHAFRLQNPKSCL